MTSPILPRLAQLAAVSALLVFAVSLALHHPDPATGAEARYLASLAAIVLLSLSLAARTAPQVVVASSLGAVLLALPGAQGTRGGLFVAMLAIAVMWTTWQTFSRSSKPALAELAGLTIAWQALAKSDRLVDLQIDVRTAIWLIALPVAAAAATAWLARLRGGPVALVTFAPLLLLIPGVGVVPTAVLVIVAAAGAHRPAALSSACWVVVASAVALWRLPEVGPALLVLVAALVMFELPGWRWLPAAGAACWAATTGTPFDGSLPTVGWLLLAFPALTLCTRQRAPLAAAGLGLALTYSSGQDPANLAPAVALLAAAVPVGEERGGFQARWSLGLLFLGALAAAYPWLQRPMLDPPPSIVGQPVITLAIAALVAAWLAWRFRGRRFLAPVSSVLLLTGAWFLVPAPARSLLGGDPVLVSAEANQWQGAVDARVVRSVTVDSFLSRSGELESGQAIGAIRLWNSSGELREFVLQQGVHTADWTAGRTVGAESPTPWISWVAPDGRLAQRYRTTWRLDPPFAAERLEFVSSPGLPGDPELAILSVVVR